MVTLAVQRTKIDRERPRESHVRSRRSTGSGSVSTEESTHKGRPYGCSFPIVGATLVVALPLQAAEIDRGHAVSPTP